MVDKLGATPTAKSHGGKKDVRICDRMRMPVIMCGVHKAMCSVQRGDVRSAYGDVRCTCNCE